MVKTKIEDRGEVKKLSPSLEKNRYSEEDLNTDLNWFNGLGVDKIEAKSYIFHLLNSEWCGE